MRKKEEKIAYCFLLPSLFGTTVFIFLPFLDVVRRSFFQAVGGTFVGLGNYREVLHNAAFLQALSHTVKFFGICLPILLTVSFGMAVGILQLPGTGKWIESLFLLPMALPVASIVVFWKLLFHDNGGINQLLSWFGLKGNDWMNTGAAFGVLVGTYIWKNLGYDMILWLTGLAAISGEQYEAAKVSGANRFQIFVYITLPQMKTCAVMTGILSFINAFRVFREAYLISGEYPHNSIYMLQHLFYNWFTKLDIQKMSAAAVMLAAGISMLFLLLEWWNEKEERQ
ncbi:MAG: sugar ABC transporter permease [Faecalicatena sp.]|uniref:carbohydrate ABC transporter permease n=1 Tax=Faecalicatena sp. TaxID=2005360 RepID=UPI002590784A|nr:sugar ABC transporter permease [Faecalicatena sp.]MCI6464114.1 sugar ABC transporter permease [Faecalicatena sp.]MDY5616964.1 sugar ABC transporter permease [Lachnospiraceae bacterium]